MLWTRVALGAAFARGAGCGGAGACRPGSCGFGVCDLDGRCRELGVRPEVRGARSVRTSAIAPGRDVLELGRAPLRLRFDLDAARRGAEPESIAEAVLVLHAAPLATPTAPRRVTVAGPGRTVERWLPLRPEVPLRFDVTSHARRAGDELTLTLRAGEARDAPWRVTGPAVSLGDRRPQLELRLRPIELDQDAERASPRAPADRAVPEA